METINDVRHFLNYLDFVADLRCDDYRIFNHTKKTFERYFQDVDSEQLIHILGVISNLRILFLNQDFNKVNPLTESLPERIFTQYEKKTLDKKLFEKEALYLINY